MKLSWNKRAKQSNQSDYYSTDIWSKYGSKLDGILPEGYIVYGELIGWTPEGAPIQKGFTYQVEHGTAELYVYRVTIVNSQGIVADLSWTQLKDFCQGLGLKHVPELWAGFARDFKPEDFLDKKFSQAFNQAVPLSKDSPCDEGVCIRVEGMTPKVYKAKSPKFLQHETKMLDKEILDIEVEA